MNAELLEALKDVKTQAFKIEGHEGIGLPVGAWEHVLSAIAAAEKPLGDEELLERVEELQSEFWEALGDLENALGIDIDGTQDFEQTSLEDLKEEAEEDEPGCQCGCQA